MASGLRRQLGVGDAVVIGAGSMIGAGVFAAWAPAAQAAGGGLLIGLVLAAIVAVCNALSSAQLAALHPESGGTYVYARHRLGVGWGHLAGAGFVVGKTASCAAMALTVGAYLFPAHERFTAVAALTAVTGANLGGLSRTVAWSKVILVVSITALATVVASAWSAPATSLHRISFTGTGPFDVIQAAGFLFFAFAGYARIATLGEEVRDPARTIPRAIPIALGAVLVVYAVVGITALAAVPAGDLAAVSDPLRLVVASSSLAGVVRIGAGVAALGVLLNLLPGVSRTMLAMARNRELPAVFARIDRHRSLPVIAEVTVAAVAAALVLVVNVRSAIAVSGVGVLTYYALTNAAALRLAPHERRFHPVVAVAGMIGCVVLVAALPWRHVVTGSGVLAILAASRLLPRRR